MLIVGKVEFDIIQLIQCMGEFELNSSLIQLIQVEFDIIQWIQLNQAVSHSIWHGWIFLVHDARGRRQTLSAHKFFSIATSCFSIERGDVVGSRHGLILRVVCY